MSEMLSQANDTLRNLFGFSEFRPNQKEIIEHVLSEKKLLAVMPTGAGKSLCYQIPAIVSSKRTIIISPLIALMDDQLSSMKLLGVKVEKIHANIDRQEAIDAWLRFKNGESKIIYMSPERLMTEKMLQSLQSLDIGLFVIDEAHCISKWGQSFRKDYEALSQLKELFPESNVIGFTATADEATRLDIADKIAGGNAKIIVRGFDRPNLYLSIKLKRKWQSQLLEFLSNRKQVSGIVYCLSRNGTEKVASFLSENGFNACAYHAGLDGDTRRKVQDRFMTEEGMVVVATIAFGMGIDKPDIRYVVHVNLPSSLEAYYQEIGRAGRDGLASETLLIYGLDDLVLRRRMIEESDAEDEYKLREHKRLDYLLSYCETPDCRRKLLLNYFDDKIDECNNCDNCLDPPKLIDGTELAQKLLSTIFRTGQYFGQVHVINVLRGMEEKNIIDKGHNNLSVFGIGSEYSKDFWQSFVRQLLAFGHLRLNIHRYGSLQITNSGMDILKNGKLFQYKEIKNESKVKKISREVVSDLDENDQSLLMKLKELRLNIAKESKLPAFTVFHDIALRDMAVLKPRTSEEFLEINGVGPSKLEKWSSPFMKIIEEHLKAIEETH